MEACIFWLDSELRLEVPMYKGWKKKKIKKKTRLVKKESFSGNYVTETWSV